MPLEDSSRRALVARLAFAVVGQRALPVEARAPSVGVPLDRGHPVARVPSLSAAVRRHRRPFQMVDQHTTARRATLRTRQRHF